MADDAAPNPGALARDPDGRSVGAGGVDWVAAWHDLVRAREAQSAARQWSVVRPGSDYWERRADQFAAVSRPTPGRPPDPLLTALTARLDPAWTVLDVGAGVGRHAVPLARLVRQVVAVEPSPALAERLRHRLHGEGVTNVTVVEARWQDADVPVADVAVCANVLAPIADAGPFLRRLDAHATRAVWLAYRGAAGSGTNTLQDALWRRFHGEPRVPEPSLAHLFCLLDQLGLAADVAHVPWWRAPSWADLDEAAADALDQLVLPPDDARAPAVRAWLAERLVARDDRLVYPLPPGRLAILHWERAEA